MKRLPLLVLCGLLFSGALHAQSSRYGRHHWLFGTQAWVDFSGGTPVGRTDGFLSSTEACASISDPQGKLLLYTAGGKIYNGDHKVIITGAGGNTDAAQGALIVPDPAGNNRYYVLTNDGKIGNLIAYTHVDMTLNGGEGGALITAKPLYTGVNESMIAITHCDGSAIWIISHGYNNNRFVAIKLTENGFEDTVISAVEPKIEGLFGYLKANSLGSLVATPATMNFAQHMVVFPFDAASGQFSEPVLKLPLIPIFASYGYGHEFSPSGRYLYFSSYTNSIYRLDLSSMDSATVMASVKPFYVSHNTAALANGPDNKLYFVQTNEPWLGVFDAPDAVDPRINEQAVNLKLKVGYFGLPNFMTGWISPQNVSQAVVMYETPICTHTPWHAYYQRSINEPDSIRLELYDPRTGEIMARTTTDTLHYTFDEAYTYGLKVVLKKACRTDSSYRKVMVFDGGRDTERISATICGNGPVRLSATMVGDATYQWSTGETDSVIAVRDTGVYTVKISNFMECSFYKVFTVTRQHPLLVEIGPNRAICPLEDELVRLDAGKDSLEYRWYPTGDTTRWIDVRETGQYYVVVRDVYGCTGGDTTQVLRKCQGFLYFPNAFSPNNDGVNDLFAPVGEEIIAYHIQIYNRWGGLVFESDDWQRGWNGNGRLGPAPEGIYIYRVWYQMLDEQRQPQNHFWNGTITLMR